ncbi:hypothetical protein LY625_03415 [Lysobacter sp. GX 14042]|uniref:hypothetical protein n=1 Tax=Lysobacter sp. GX 14042 TaxID=2907155 RepID=UPI001F3C0EF9|nr:hypothetical protein [Lysobacter sp. GX 14042]MCE7031675.1 hypothetical protein [Lysobacter sp. GX 14042]
MSLKLGLTGMDQATRSKLEAVFAQANALAGEAWQLVEDGEASHVVVDMDSMYGPMSWLRLHGDGKQVIGLTSAPRTQADYHLPQPLDAERLAAVLRQIAPVPPRPSGLTPAPEAGDQLPEEQPAPADEEQAAPGHFGLAPPDTGEAGDRAEPGSAAVARVVPAAATIEPPAPDPAVEPGPPRARTLGEWLAAGEPGHRFALGHEGVELLVDPVSSQYHGPASLKPLSGHVTTPLMIDELGPEPADWEARAAAAGPGQPLSRLLWFATLRAGEGQLLPGFDPQARYQLLKWPQTEREYPRHFRIATVMMRGPAQLQAIADASGVPLEEVTDFVNANLATGFARPEQLDTPAPPAGRGGLFGRLRGR